MCLTSGVITPEDKRHDKFEVVQKLMPRAVGDVLAFEFTKAMKLSRGEWRFMVFQEDSKFIEQKIEVR